VQDGEKQRTELIDFSLIDETLNEWLTEAASSSTPEEAPKPLPTVDQRKPQPVFRSAQKSVRPTERSSWTPSKSPTRTPTRKVSASTPDRILEEAVRRGLMTAAVLESMKQRVPAGHELDWRMVARFDSSWTIPLERLAAELYGFRPVLICQMGTLVLADLLVRHLGQMDWKDLFDHQVIPVVEHGASPDLHGRVVFVTRDPSLKAARQLVERLPMTKTELTWADASVVEGMMALMQKHIPFIRTATGGVPADRTSPMKLVPSSDSSRKAA